MSAETVGGAPPYAADLAGASRFALDTEFMGEGRYRTLLCLVQLAIPDAIGEGERIELLDPLSGEEDFTPLAAALADPQVRVVVHAGRQDVALARRHLRTEVRNVFDTQVAAGFAGLGAQSSYESLLSELLGVRVGKSASFTRWDARPLSREQLAYAREDVVHLLALAEELERRLERLGRLEWALEECSALESASDERDVDAIFERLPRVRTLSAGARPIARELVAWRERVARRQDRPAQSVLADAALVEIAKRRPANPAQLAALRGAGTHGMRRRAGELLEVVASARELPEDPPPSRPASASAQPQDAPLIALAEALLRARAREADLAYELLASRADLQLIVATHRESGREADARTLRGWRRELAGAEVLELLEGGLSLSVQSSALRVRRDA
ncbi:MAG TPA: HRDC domain-containing protein [Solirubrobacteraceae bacterium]|nr:HRDC domain-containing protein [Solirubrobacteraceae bacterium]